MSSALSRAQSWHTEDLVPYTACTRELPKSRKAPSSLGCTIWILFK